MMEKPTEKRKLVGNRAPRRGLPPGSAVHVGPEHGQSGRVTVLDYDAENLSEAEIADIRDCFAMKETPTVTWISVAGKVDIKALEALGEYFGLHPLALADALNAYQRPKYEDYGQTLQIVLRMCRWNASAGEVTLEQVALIIGPTFVISFQESSEDVFEDIRARLREGKGRIRQMGADFLAYSLLNAVMEVYFAMLERRGELIEVLEQEVVARPDSATLRRLHGIRRDGMLFRRVAWPLREVMAELRRGESALLSDEIRPYLSDLYDDAIQIIETMETLRDVLTAMTETYLSVINNRMNEVMKLLTVIATIFIPLTFIVGLYGMNLQMPEFEWPWAYPVVLAAMAGLAAWMVLYFKRKKWL